MSALSKPVEWLEDMKNRRKVYTAAGGLGIVLVAFGVITNGQEAQDLLILGNLLGIGSAGLARKHSKKKV